AIRRRLRYPPARSASAAACRVRALHRPLPALASCAVLLPRQRDRSFDCIGKLLELHLRRIAIQHVQALATVAQADAVLTFRPQEGTAVADGDIQPLAVATRLDLDPHRIATALYAMFEGVFQQRLQQHG